MTLRPVDCAPYRLRNTIAAYRRFRAPFDFTIYHSYHIGALTSYPPPYILRAHLLALPF